MVLLAAIGKFPNAIGKLRIGKTLATNRKEVDNAMIGDGVLTIYWLSLINWLRKALRQIVNDW